MVTNPSVSAVAPARVNIIGEHTDHNEGLVLPTCTTLFTRVTATRRPDRMVRAITTEFGDTEEFSLDELSPGANSGWVEYVKGVAAGLQHLGIAVPLPIWRSKAIFLSARGLSSSASLELAVAYALLGIANATLAPAELARVCQKAEHDFAGVQCAIHDSYWQGILNAL